MAKPISLATTNQFPAMERTESGKQYLIDGYRSPTQREKLEVMAQRPMLPTRPCAQRPCNHGLFDEDARNQLDLFG